VRIILADVVPKDLPKPEAHKHFAELARLIETLGGMSIVKIIQKRGRPSGKTYLGTGKAEEIGEISRELKADAVVINDILKGNQIFELTRRIPVLILDRVDVILRIFYQHATTLEAKLQIRRARLEYDIPKIYGRAATTLFEREKGGIGVDRGAGETGIEIEKRHIRRQIKKIDEKIEKLKKNRRNQRQNRSRNNFRTVALVGYTNGGKSTLLRALTGKKGYADDKLFTTLDPRIGQVFLPESKNKVLISDTIGFIENLPPMLIAAFKATLEEVQEADLILHVFDISDSVEEIERKKATVIKVLKSLKCDQKSQILLANKIDLLSPEETREILDNKDFLVISAQEKINFNALKQEIEKGLSSL